MSKSYRIRTQPGVDKSIKVQIDQEFDYLEILSLKILQSEIYTRQCADYGVIVGRVSVNNGFGIPNAKISVFIPIDNEDQSNPVISELYPYKSLSDLNEDGYRYNLLPYKKSYSAHVPTGTFFTRNDVLTDPTLIQVYDKYYKFNAVTNDSGDYMIFGVPVGVQTIVMDVDLSDIGEFSLSPQDLIRMGVATEAQVSGTNFKSSNNLRELPQIITVNKIIEVEPLWGQPEICNLGITRTDFDLSAEANIVIQPTAIFMGSIISGPDRTALSVNCRPPSRAGHLCNLTTGPGSILAIRQTIFQDNLGRPILESYELESGGKVIDENGTWMIDVPMNLDYYITNEFGEQVLSNDPEKGIPTKSKYRFKVKWGQSNSLSQTVRRANFLVPNIRENSGVHEDGSYAFSLDWDDYAKTGTSETYQIIQDAIDCEDRFYLMQYNKVYTVSQFISGVKSGNGFERYIGIKNILDDTCTTSNYTFPTNDGNFRFDILYVIFMFFSLILTPIMYAIVILLHFLYFVVKLLRILLLGLSVYYAIIAYQVGSGAFGVSPVGPTVAWALILAGASYLVLSAFCFALWRRLMKMKLKTINLPILTYPECSLCDCKQGDTPGEEDPDDEETSASSNQLVPCPNLKSYRNITTLTLSPGLKQLFTSESFRIPVETPNNPNGFTSQMASAMQENMTGNIYNFQYASNNIGAPFIKEVNEGTIRYQVYTTALPFADRINLFNLKSKYFSDSSNNPGGGVNRISVNFNPQDDTQKHYDNTIVILCNPDSLSRLNAGQLITFQDPTKSGDVNTRGGVLNIYGNKAITGITSTGQTNITVNYARFNGSGNNSITYSVFITAETTNNYHKFPTDLEYFQVITGMTYNQFSGQCSTITNYNSLNNRYLNNTILMARTDAQGQNEIRNLNLNPIDYVENYENLCVLILNRGVDPYTPKVPIKYGLGILFGYSGTNATESITVEGNYHMNIPIQGGFKNISHNSNNYPQIVLNGVSAGSNVLTETYTNNNQDLFFNSFSYKPQKDEVLGELTGYTYGIPFTYTGVTISKYSGFNSNLISFYSSMDNNSPSNVNVVCGGNVENVKQRLDNEVIKINSNFGIQVSDDNRFSWRIVTRFFGSFPYNWLGPYPGVDPITGLPTTIPTAYNRSNTQFTEGYFKNEIVEGGPIMFTNFNTGGYFDDARFELITDTSPYSVTSNYFSPIYNTTGNTLNFSLGNNDNQIIMRADRLPSSTNIDEYCCNGMVLQKNNNFQIYLIPEDGVLDVTSTSDSSGSVGSGELTYAQDDLVGSTGITRVLNSFTCEGSVNLDCYDCERNGPNGTIKINDGGCRRENGKVIFEFGCYKLITTIFISLPRDLALTSEWIARNLVLLGACRNVFSHRFVNNWINGTLYTFPIKVEVKGYTSPLSSTPNQPIVDYAQEVIKLHEPSRNYYYRCTKYNLQNDSFSQTPDVNHIGYPTTIIDLGPRNNFIQELVMSDEYDGYVVNRLESSTFGNVDDILNLFIISRFIDNTFLDNLLGGLNIFAYFTNQRRNRGVGGTRGLIDSDYSQMISINSEFGVSPFEAANYPDTTIPGEQNPIYFNCNDVIGIFYSSDTQSRDYITPKRTIVNGSVPITSNCSFNNFSVFSQRVPLSQWFIDGGTSDSIFGKSSNNWSYSVGGEVFSHRYQSLDRLLNTSRYFRNTYISQTQFQKGYIYAVKSSTTSNSIIITAERQYWDFNNPEQNLVTVGAPFHFYFGLKRGASSFDRFRTKWINPENITN